MEFDAGKNSSLKIDNDRSGSPGSAGVWEHISFLAGSITGSGESALRNSVRFLPEPIMVLQHEFDRSTEIDACSVGAAGPHISQVAFPGAFSMGQDATTMGRPMVKIVNNPASPSEIPDSMDVFLMTLLNMSQIYCKIVTLSSLVRIR